MNNPSIFALVLTIVALIWCGVLTALVASQKRFWETLAKGVTKKDLQSLLKQLFNSLQEAGKQISLANKRLDLIETQNTTHLQKVGFIRFNPFGDTGGDQSFCLCLLDGYNNGIVITSLHNRDSTRIYAKEIRVDSLNREDFSREEWQAYDIARQSKQVIEQKGAHHEIN